MVGDGEEVPFPLSTPCSMYVAEFHNLLSSNFSDKTLCSRCKEAPKWRASDGI